MLAGFVCVWRQVQCWVPVEEAIRLQHEPHSLNRHDGEVLNTHAHTQRAAAAAAAAARAASSSSD
jgi:hypothetical protein